MIYLRKQTTAVMRIMAGLTHGIPFSLPIITIRLYGVLGAAWLINDDVIDAGEGVSAHPHKDL